MSKVWELIKQAKQAGDLQLLCDAIPYARFMGFTVHHDDTGLMVRMAYAEDLVGNPNLPALHGGTLSALLETAAQFQLMHESETVIIPKTINLTVDYLRSGQPMDTFARGIATRRGRRVTNSRMEAWQEDPARPIAVAHGHFLIAAADEDNL